MKFAEVPGQENLKVSLAQTVDSGHVAHAQLFVGPEGGVALMLAMAYSQYLNCENPVGGDSCGNCFACVKSSRFIHPDLHLCFPWAKSKILDDNGDEIRAFLPLFRNFLLEAPFGRLADWSERAEFESRTPITNIKTVRDIMQGLQLKAYEGKFKVVIIWMPETMRGEGSNAFLKLLEEPPPFTIFLLVTTEPELLLPTVISRTQRISVARLSDEELAGFLISRFSVEEGKAMAVATLAEGNIPEALQLLDEKEDDYHRLFMEWQRACFLYDVQKLIQFTNAFVELGKELQKSYLRFSLGKLRSGLVLSSGAPDVAHLPEKEAFELGRFGRVFSLPLIELMMTELEKAYYHIDRNGNGRIIFLDLSLTLAQGYSKLAVRPSR